MLFFGNQKLRSILAAFGGKQRYQSLRPVGEGGISTVSSFLDLRLNRVVALKEIRTEHLANAELVQFFINESKLMAYLDHPGVISVYDAFLQDGRRPCYTMKLCEGKSLRELLDAQESSGTGPLRLQRSLEIFLKFCQTMAYVHDKGVLHLDLKPENIMVGTYGEVLVLDWGSARLYQSDRFYENLERFTHDTTLARFEKEDDTVVLVTPRYMSPEQSESGREKLTCASDVFSAGVIFYEMLTGRHAFPGQEPRELMKQVRSSTPPPPHEVNRDVPRMLSQICLKMIEKNLAARYHTFQEVLHELSLCQGSGETFPTRLYQPGETIFHEGDAGDYAFIVLSGEVEIVKQVESGPKVIATLGEGEIVGELAILGKQPRTAAARARVPTQIRILSREDIEHELEKLSPWVGKMITSLSSRFLELRGRLLEQEQRPGN